MEKILGAALFSIEDRDLATAGLRAYRAGTGDFADHLLGERNRRIGCGGTPTFDRALRESGLFTLL